KSASRTSRSQSRPRLSGNGNQEPKNEGPRTGSQMMFPPTVSMNIPAWPSPVIRIALLLKWTPRFYPRAREHYLRQGSVLEQPADIVSCERLCEEGLIVEHRGKQTCLALLQRQYFLLDGAGGNHPVHEHLLVLSDAVG